MTAPRIERQRRYRTISLIFDSQSFAACCQAVHIKTICSTCWVGCVLAANEPLRGLDWKRAKASSFLGDLGSLVSLHIRARLLRSRVPKRTDPKGKRGPCSGTTSPIDPWWMSFTSCMRLDGCCCDFIIMRSRGDFITVFISSSCISTISLQPLYGLQFNLM